MDSTLIADANSIASQVAFIQSQNTTEEQLLSFLGTEVATKDPAHDSALFGEETPESRGKHLLARVFDAMKNAICNDFKYCEKKDDVETAIKKYIPELIQVFIKDKVGASGPAWLTGILGIFGIASWQLAVAGLVAYAIYKGLNYWCQCAAATIQSHATITAPATATA